MSPKVFAWDVKTTVKDNVMADGIAKKKDPQKWAQAKARAKAKMGGKHSARAMQLATKYYKDVAVNTKVKNLLPKLTR